MNINAILSLKVGDKDSQGSFEIIGEDRLCYQVVSSNHGAKGVRTLSKKLIEEYVNYYAQHPESSASDVRVALCGLSDTDKFEYGYSATLWALAKLNAVKFERDCRNFKHLLEYFCAHLRYIVTENKLIPGYEKYLKRFVDNDTFRKSGQGYRENKIQEQIREWEDYTPGTVGISVYGSSFKSYSTYLHWKHTSHNISANWEGDNISSLQLVECKGNHKWESLDPKFEISELGLYDEKDPNENIVVLYKAFVNMMSETVSSVITDGYVSQASHYLLQQIFYGAPGTGKSHTINEVTKGENVIRTTFHPDSDYSSFVGAYKPTMGLLPICDELGQPMTIGGTVRHKEQVVYEFVEQAFLQAYVNAWKNRQVGSLTIDNGNYALSGMNNDVVYWRNCNTKPESNEENTAQKETIKKYYDGIAPEDTKTNAQKVIASYLKGLDSDFEKAWIKLKARLSTVTPQFLVIEEINRGNCAQIFGDIFQLLDRNDYGFSVYPINADKDMKKHLEKAFKDVSIDNADIINQQYKGRDVVKEVLNGDILLLPDNLYIWATMNTSDQSLFPIDSAFKRRWDWKYVPIEQPEEGAEGEPRKWKIKADGHWCYWWEFLQAINEEIEEVTHSEDKQLGYFFAKPQEGEYIDAKTFVSKVVFYLWNDVFKDENSEIFRYKKLEGKWDVGMPAPKRDILYFRSFVKGREDVDEKMVRWFVNNLLKEHNVVLLDDGHQNPVTTDDISKEENIAWMRPYKEESPADADGTEDAIDGNNVNSPNGEDLPTDQVKNVVG